MTAVCKYQLPHLSTETMPWVNTFCYTDDEVPAGCPLHFVSADPAPSQISVNRWHGYYDTITTIPSTTTTLGSTTERVIGSSPDCAVQIDASVQFTRYEVQAPGLVEGDSFYITYQTGGQRADGANTAPVIAATNACPTPTWPTTFVVTCGFGGDAGIYQPPMDSDPDRGCSVGGHSSALSLLMLVAIARRGRRRADHAAVGRRDAGSVPPSLDNDPLT